MLVSASSLVRHCGYARRLSRERPKSASAQTACDRGVIFHRAIDEWRRCWEIPTVDDPEIQGWIDLLASQWTPHVDSETEVAWGLSDDGDRFEAVNEPRPHEYVAVSNRPLLTAGRADVAWPAGGIVHCVDWKTGKYPTTPAVDNLQVHAAGIAIARRQNAAGYRPAIYYARDGAWDWGPAVLFGSAEHARMLEAIRAAALLDEAPRPGDWCSGCWERRGCGYAAEAAREYSIR